MDSILLSMISDLLWLALDKYNYFLKNISQTIIVLYNTLTFKVKRFYKSMSLIKVILVKNLQI